MTNIPKPDHWGTVPLSAVCDFQNGYAFKNKDFQEPSVDVFVVFKMGNIERGGGLKHDAKCSYIAKDKCETLSRFVLNKGDLTMSMTDMKASMALLGHTARVDQGGKYILNQRVGRVTVRDKSRLDDRFLYYYTNSHAYISYLRGVAHSGVQVNLSTTAIKESPVVLPNLKTQQKIASILSAYDGLIENNLRRIKILEKIAQNLYREWFVKFHFPGHEKVRMVDSPLGMIPDGWEVCKLLDLSEVTYGFAFKSKQFNTEGEGEPVVRIRDVLAGVSNTYSKEKCADKYKVANGDILVGMDGDFHMGVWVGGEALLVQRVARFRSKGDIGRHHLFLSIQDPIRHFDATITGTTVAHLGDKHIRTIEIVRPPSELREKTNEYLEPIFDELLNLRVKNQILRQTRGLLLPKLITGELDVSGLDIEIDQEAVA